MREKNTVYWLVYTADTRKTKTLLWSSSLRITSE